MALVVGTDSYVTVAEALSYIQSHYLSTSSQRTNWESLSEGDQENVLRSACQRMETLRFSGCKKFYGQVLSFPRATDEETGAPQRVKNAQCEMALDLLPVLQSGGDSEADRRFMLIRQGVTSFSVGNLSETYKGGSAQAFLVTSQRVQTLLSPWLNGGFSFA